MKTVKITFSGILIAQNIVNELVVRSQYFVFTPLPDGEYEIEVKEENEQFVKAHLIISTF